MIKKLSPYTFYNFIKKILLYCNHFFTNISLRYKLFLINLLGLGLFLIGSLYLDNFRERLIESSRESLLIKARLISNVLATAAHKDVNVFAEGIDIRKNRRSYLRIYKILARSVTSKLLDFKENRAIIYDRFGSIVHDTDHFIYGDTIYKSEITPSHQSKNLVESITLFGRKFLDICYHFVFSHKDAHEKNNTNILRKKAVQKALAGQSTHFTSWNEQKKLVISVVIPVQRFHAVLGVFSLTSNGSNIDKAVAEEQKRIIIIFLIAFFAVAFLSFSLAYTIVNPILRLSHAAKKITSQTFLSNHNNIPDFSQRGDEIGYLSQAIRNMTKNLIGRIEAIENFAADVAHELKNPLTSLRSAVETLPQTRKKSDKDRLLAIIKDDVIRMDRLITDIAESSRLDAELGREKPEYIDIANTLHNYISYFKNIHPTKECIKLHIDKNVQHNNRFSVKGHALRLEQVLRNVIDNAHSYNHNNKPIDIYLQYDTSEKIIKIIIADQGKGIAPENLENIFERFYTDRQEDRNNHSGLGLSIARQIVTAHKGKIWAENRPNTYLNDDKSITHGTVIFIHIPSDM